MKTISILVSILSCTLLVSGCASTRSPADPTRLIRIFPLLEQDAKSFKKIALAVAPPQLQSTHLTGAPPGSYQLGQFSNSLPPPIALASLLLSFAASQGQVARINASIDSDSELTRVDSLVRPIFSSTVNDLTRSLETMGYIVAVTDDNATPKRGDTGPYEDYRQRMDASYRELLKTNDAVLTASHYYKFVRVGASQKYVPHVLALLNLYRLDNQNRLYVASARVNSRSALRAEEGEALGRVFEPSDFVPGTPQSLEAVRYALQTEFAAANSAFLADFSVPD